MAEARAAATSKPGLAQQGDVRPIPDPTLLTTEAVNSAVERAQEYTNNRLAVLEERLNGIDKAAEVLHETVTRVPTETQQAVGHLRELMDEKFDGVKLVLDEQRRAIVVGEQEREKSASALRGELARRIEDGDRALRDHIAGQISQINAALVSAELLERERMGRAEDQVTAERRITELTREMSDTAILKAESAGDKRFEEFQKTVTSQLDAMRIAIQDLTRRIDTGLGGG